MSRNVEYISPAGIRQDGRRAKEYRTPKITLSINSDVDGSCRYEVGGTIIVAFANGPKDNGPKGGRMGDVPSEEGVITCEVGLAAFSGERRRQAQRKNKQTDQLAAAVVSTLSSVALLDRYPNSVIQLFVEILQHDGSERSAVINAASLALVDACIAMRDLPIAVTTGYIENQPLIDLTNAETRSQCPTAVVAVSGHQPDKILWMDMESRVTSEVLDALMQLASQCSGQLFEQCIGVEVKKQFIEAIQRRGVQGFIHLVGTN